MLKKILLGFAALVVVFLIVVALQPNEYRVARTAAVAAAPDRVFAQVNDFHNWEAWSPWAKLDPNAKATFEGPRSGQGAVFIWAGNDEIGEGRMTADREPPERPDPDQARLREADGRNERRRVHIQAAGQSIPPSPGP